MATAEPLNQEAKQKVAEIVMHDLSSQFGDEIKFETVRIMSSQFTKSSSKQIIPAEDEFGDPYHRIEVIYSGDGELLDPAWLNGFRRRNRDKLAQWGVNTTSESYIDKTEDGPWSEMASTAPEEGSNG